MGFQNQAEVIDSEGTALRNAHSSSDLLLTISSTVILIILFMIILVLSGGEIRFLAILPILALLTLGILSFELSCLLLISALFVDLYPFGFSLGVWFSLPFALSFLCTHRRIEWKEFSNPLTKPLIIYGLCIVPSLLNAARPFVSFFMLFNVLAFLIVMYSLISALRSYEGVNRIVIMFLGWVIVDSLYVIALGFTGTARPFGFAGIWFVDYSALGVCLASAIALVSVGLRRVAALGASFIMAAALVLTQTRSTWMSAVVTLGIFAIYVFVNAERFGFTRQRIILRTGSGSIMLIGVVIVVLSINPKIENRAVQITKQSGYGIDQQGNVENSLGSRILIWDTAFRAFKAHPIVGIGVYGFRYSSYHYSQLPKFLYRKFVENLTVHQTHLAVLAETGLIGFLGFAIFILTLLKHTFRTVRIARDALGRRYALVAAVGVVYCTVSMTITDAWLWGQQIVLLGLVVGSMLAVRNIANARITAKE